MNANEQPENHTPDFRQPSGRRVRMRKQTVILPSGQYGGYTASDFPGTAGCAAARSTSNSGPEPGADHGSAAAETPNWCFDRRRGDRGRTGCGRGHWLVRLPSRWPECLAAECHERSTAEPDTERHPSQQPPRRLSRRWSRSRCSQTAAVPSAAAWCLTRTATS